MPSALAATYYPEDNRDDFIQFDAATNRGNSGGPLVNAEGRLVGVVAQKQFDEEAISWAILIDRIRRLFGSLVAAEEAGGYFSGLSVDLLTPQAVVRDVAAGSPSAKLGMVAGDTIVAIDGKAVRTGPDWLMLLSGRKAHQKVPIDFERAGVRRHADLVLADYPLAPPESRSGKVPGLRYSVYPGHFSKLPDFRRLRPAASGKTDHLQTSDLVSGDKDFYALTFEGYLAVPKTGLYRFTLASDDGSKLLLDGKLLIDNDYAHPEQEMGQWARISAGPHRLRIEYFNCTGEAILRLLIQEQGDKRREVPREWFFRDP